MYLCQVQSRELVLPVPATPTHTVRTHARTRPHPLTCVRAQHTYARCYAFSQTQTVHAGT